MRTPNQNNQGKSSVVAVLAMLLMLISGCNRGPTNILSVRKETLSRISQPVRVSPGTADAAEPAIAASPDGSVYVVWVDHKEKMQADVMIARFTRDGQMESSAARVNLQPGIATAWRGDPPTVAVSSDNTVFVGWTAKVAAEHGHATEMYLSSSRDHGQTFGPPVKVNDDTKPAVHGMHSLAIGGDGRVYLAWLDERNLNPMPDKPMKMDGKSASHHQESNRELFVSSSSDGGRSFTPNQRVATDVCPCCKTSLAVSPEGRLYLSWRQVLPGDFRHIAIASSTNGGASFTEPVIVSDDQWVLRGCPVSGASLSAAKQGTLRVLWYAAGEKGEHGVYWSASQDGGQTFSPRQLLAATSAIGTPVLLSDGSEGSFGVWEGSSGINTLLFASPLRPNSQAGDERQIVGVGELPAAAINANRLYMVSLQKEEAKRSVWLSTVATAF